MNNLSETHSDLAACRLLWQLGPSASSATLWTRPDQNCCLRTGRTESHDAADEPDVQTEECFYFEKLEEVFEVLLSSLSSDMESVCVWLVCVCVLRVGAHSSLDRSGHAHLDHQHDHLVSHGNAASGKTHIVC